jgi:hypothetical protein
VLLAKASSRSWAKKYISKQICLRELIATGLLRQNEKAEVEASDFEITGGALMFHTQIEPENAEVSRVY